MKKIFILITAMIVFFQFQHNNLLSANETLNGKWSGTFMGQFQIYFEFKLTSTGNYSGRLTMFDGSHQIQNDQLSKIVLNGNDLSFYISAKSTPFRGKVDFEQQIISGNFEFPDRSLHPVTVSKVFKKEAIVEEKKLEMLYASLPADLLKTDVYLLYAKLQELHPKLFAYTSQSEFGAMTSMIAGNISDPESIIDFYHQASSITDKVGCSHTGIRLPNDMTSLLKQEGNYFPLRLFFQKGEAFYVKGPGQNAKLNTGDKIVEINGRPVSSIIDQVLTFIPAEGNNNTTKYNEMNRRFPEYFVFVDNSKNFEISYLSNGKKVVEKLTLPSGNYDEFANLYGISDQGLNDDFPINFRLEKNKNTGVLTIASFEIRDVNYYISYMDSIFTLLNRNDIKNLIIDLRNNSGGHPIFAAQLFSYLTDKPFVYFDANISKVEEFTPLYSELQPNQIHFEGNCYLLMNGGCLSTTGHFISLMKYYSLATFVGEAPGSTYQCNDNSKQFVLPNTGIEINIPTAVFQTAVNPSVFKNDIVDIPVKPELSDVLEENDRCMNITFEHFPKPGYTVK